MKKLNIFVTLCASIFVQSVNAAVIVSTVASGNSIVDTGSTAGDSSFYVEFFNQNSVQIDFDNAPFAQDNIVMELYNSTGWSGFTFKVHY